MHQDKTVIRALWTSLAVAVAVTLVFLAFGRRDWGGGFVLGSIISLMSLTTLLVIVPLLIRPGAPHYVKGLLSATLFMKIPIYAVCVSYSNHAHGIEPMATVLGATLVPLVLTFGAAWTVVTEAMREPAKVVTAKRYSFGEPARPQTAPDTHRTEGATLRAAGANPVREGI